MDALSIKCPALNCKRPSILYSNLLDHYQDNHSNAEYKNDVLTFNGSIETLKTSTFIMNCFDKTFFPQFYIQVYFSFIVYIVDIVYLNFKSA